MASDADRPGNHAADRQSNDPESLRRWITFIEGVLSEMSAGAPRPAVDWLRERLEAELAQKHAELRALTPEQDLDKQPANS